MIVDCAVYVEGRRHADFPSLDAALEVGRPDRGFVWLGLHEPTEAEFESVAAHLHLHPLAVEDAIKARQRPKLERYGDTLFLVLKPAEYVDHEEVVRLSQIMLFVGPGFVVTVRHGAVGALAEVRRALEADPTRLAWGPSAVMHAVCDHVVDQYASVLGGLDADIDEIELAVFDGPRPTHTERIFKLKREVLEFRRAVDPLAGPLEDLARGLEPFVDEHRGHYFRDVHDHCLRVADQAETFDQVLDSALQANVAQVGMRQNEDMRKISAWVAIGVVPTMVAGVYGMNFEHMPELTWQLGYPLVLATMVAACTALYRNFKRRGWL